MPSLIGEIFMQNSISNKIIHYQHAAFFIGLGLSALIAFIAPRFLAYWPGILGVLGLTSYVLIYKSRPVIPWRYLQWSCALLLLAGISCFWSVDQSFALERTLKLGLILIPSAALFSCVLSFKVQEINLYVKFLSAAILIALAICVLEVLLSYPIYQLTHDVPEKKVDRIVINRTVVALSAMLFFVFAIEDKKHKNLVKAVFLAFLGVLIFCTQSQSAQLGVVLGVIFYFCIKSYHKAFWVMFAVLLIGASLSAPLLAPWLYNNFADTISVMPFVGGHAGYGGHRLEIWDAVSRYALQNPLTGFGIEATRAITDFDMNTMYRGSNQTLHPHNFALQLWIEFGVIGAVFGSAFIAYLIKELSALKVPSVNVALPGFFVILAAASFGYGLWQGWFLGLIMIIICMTIIFIRIYENREDQK